MSAQTDLDIVKLQTTLDRVLNHQITHSQRFEKVEGKVDLILNGQHGMEIKIIEGDNAVRSEYKEDISSAYKTMFGIGFIVICSLTGIIWAIVQKKLGV